MVDDEGYWKDHFLNGFVNTKKSGCLDQVSALKWS